MNHSDKESIGLFLFETSSYEEGGEEGEGKRYAMLGFPKRFGNPPQTKYEMKIYQAWAGINSNMFFRKKLRLKISLSEGI